MRVWKLLVWLQKYAAATGCEISLNGQAGVSMAASLAEDELQQ
jgi:hypothetical protein